MPLKPRFPAIPPLQTGLAAVLLALVISWPVKDALFLSLTGTPLSIRSPLVQTGYVILLAGSVALILLLAFRKQVDWLLSHVYLAFFTLPLIPLAAHGFMGSFSRFVADDFSSATLAVNKGVLGATWDWYINWSGRFSASFFDSLFGYLGPASLSWVVGLTLLLLLAGLAACAGQLFPMGTRSFRLGLSLFFPALVLVSAFGLAPDLPQSLYWGQGMRSLIFPFIPAAFLAAYIYSLCGRAGRIPAYAYLVVGLLSFIAGGFGETYVAIQTSTLALSIIAVYFSRPFGFRKKVIPLLLTSLIASLTAMAVMVAAPGNAIRQTYFLPSPRFVDLLIISARSLWLFLQTMLISADRLLILAVLILAAVSAGYLYAKQANLSIAPFNYPENPFFRGYTRTSLSILVSGVLLLYASLVPSAYGMSGMPPERTLIIPVLIFCCMLAALAALLGIHLYAEKHFAPVLSATQSAVLVWALFFLLSFYTYRVTCSILRVRADYQHFAEVFDRADRMIREARAQGESSVQVPEVHNHFGLSDYGAGTTYWLDQAVDSYYDIHVIINKGMK
jgi:hypothetical protein